MLIIIITFSNRWTWILSVIVMIAHPVGGCVVLSVE